jgi:hypothetical protein
MRLRRARPERPWASADPRAPAPGRRRPPAGRWCVEPAAPASTRSAFREPVTRVASRSLLSDDLVAETAADPAQAAGPNHDRTRVSRRQLHAFGPLGIGLAEIFNLRRRCLAQGSEQCGLSSVQLRRRARQPLWTGEGANAATYNGDVAACRRTPVISRMGAGTLRRLLAVPVDEAVFHQTTASATPRTCPIGSGRRSRAAPRTLGHR